jgi:hypothetical protein
MAPSYDRATSRLMAAFTGLAYAQFEHNQPKVVLPAGWTQTASFQAPEIDFARLAATPATLSAAQQLAPTALRAAGLGAGVRDVFFGFAAGGPTYDCIVLRGTSTGEEVVIDLTGAQVDVPVIWNLKLGKVHLGFLVLFAFLYEQLQVAAKSFGGTRPLLFVGHSLGSALATLAALATSQLVLPGRGAQGLLQLYSFAGPRVGDPTFKAAYDAAVPGSFRVVNLSDVVPLLPPTSITVGGFTFDYAHVGSEWSYLWQAGNVVSNHSLSDNYVPALGQGVETDATRRFPVSGLP